MICGACGKKIDEFRERLVNITLWARKKEGDTFQGADGKVEYHEECFASIAGENSIKDLEYRMREGGKIEGVVTLPPFRSGTTITAKPNWIACNRCGSIFNSQRESTCYICRGDSTV